MFGNDVGKLMKSAPLYIIAGVGFGENKSFGLLRIHQLHPV